MVLRGTKLDKLFEFLSAHQIKIIRETKRYAQLSETEFSIESIEKIEH